MAGWTRLMVGGRVMGVAEQKMSGVLLVAGLARMLAFEWGLLLAGVK